MGRWPLRQSGRTWPKPCGKARLALFGGPIRIKWTAKEIPMLLRLRDVTKTYPASETPVLRGVSFDVVAGEMLALTGESGSGKSTLLHLIGGLDTADGGVVALNGHDLTTLDDAGRAALRRGTVGVIFQQFNLIPALTVAANITFQARLAGRYDPAFAEAMVQRLGLGDHLRKYPEQLSGGQQQRVAIARTLAPRPQLVLADEPTGNLDEATADTVFALMCDLVAETGAGLILVTHSERLAARLGRRLHLRAGLLS
jgi:putative ABC transport system ATP-binding protein